MYLILSEGAISTLFYKYCKIIQTPSHFILDQFTSFHLRKRFCLISQLLDAHYFLLPDAEPPPLKVNEELLLVIAKLSDRLLRLEFVAEDTMFPSGGLSLIFFTTIGTVSEVFGIITVAVFVGAEDVLGFGNLGGALAGRVGKPSVGIGMSGTLSASSGDGVLSRLDTSTFGAK